MSPLLAGAEVFVLNPHAGGARADVAALGGLLVRPGAVVLVSDRPGRAAELARAAADAGAARVVACGGDGTVSEVARGLLRAGRDGGGPELGLVPLGTGNDLARSLGVPAGVQEALATLDGGGRLALDVMAAQVDGGPVRVALNTVIGGPMAMVGERVDDAAKAQWGPFAYLAAGAGTLQQVAPFGVDVVTAAGSERFSAVGLAVANGRWVAGGCAVAPGAMLDDGLLDVVVVVDGPWLQLAGGLARYLAGADVRDSPLVQVRRAAKVSVRAPETLTWNADGEPLGQGSLDVAVDPGALEVICGPMVPPPA